MPAACIKVHCISVCLIGIIFISDILSLFHNKGHLMTGMGWVKGGWGGKARATCQTIPVYLPGHLPKKYASGMQQRTLYDLTGTQGEEWGRCWVTVFAAVGLFI